MLRSSRRLFVAVAFLGAGAALAGCSTTTRPLAPVNGYASYQIECIRIGECWVEARRACGGPYRTLERRDNWISESDLPGLNERTYAHSYSRWTLQGITRPVEPYGPGMESDEPLPITDVVVMCTNG